MRSLVGYTGFVGSNLYKCGKFDSVYNSKNIQEAYGTKPDLLVYAGVRAEKYLANNDPETDLKQIRMAEENIRNIDPKRVVLISTIDVFGNPCYVDETSEIMTEGLHAYGYHRYLLECRVREMYPDALVVRLPALYGENLKKNFIYDYIHKIPFMLNEKKMVELTGKKPELINYYQKQENGFYKVNITGEREEVLRQLFVELEFSALDFTDSRSIFQFYNLGRLWADIETALANNLKLWHAATEPVSAGEVYFYLTGEEFVNMLSGKPAFYDYRTIHDKFFNGKDGYIQAKREVLDGIKRFVEDNMVK